MHENHHVKRKTEERRDNMAKIPFNAARVAAGLTQQELAEKMGVSRSTVNDWENGKREIRTPYLYLFCTITGFTEDDIILPKVAT
jgi:transcriptional regulator with XRE-family HTH domain